MFTRGFWTERRRRQLWYVPILSISLGLTFLRLLVFARLLDIAQFSAFSAGLLVSSSVSMLSCLGIQLIIQRDLPGLLQQGRRRRGTVLTLSGGIVAVACALLGGALAAAGVAVAGLSGWQLAVAVLHGLSQQAFVLATIESRSAGEPLRYANDNLRRAVAIIIAGTSAAAAGLEATTVLLVEAAVSIALALGILGHQLRAAHMVVRSGLWSAVHHLRRLPWRSAFVLLAVTMVAFASVNADRWLAAETLTASEFGEYALAWIVVMVSQSAQVLINTTVFPMLARRHAMAGADTTLRLGAKASTSVLVVAAGVAALAAYPLSRAIPMYYPDYDGAIPLLPWLLGAAVLRVSDFWSSVLIIIGREGLLLALQVTSLACVATVWAAWDTGPAGPGSALGMAQLAFSLAATLHVLTMVTALVAVKLDRSK